MSILNLLGSEDKTTIIETLNLLIILKDMLDKRNELPQEAARVIDNFEKLIKRDYNV